MTQVQQQDSPPVPRQRRHQLSPFSRHYLQMVAAMAVGMIATAAVFTSVVGLKTWDEVTVQYPTQVLLAMAVGMTVPMVAWMQHLRMSRRSTYEMAAAMVLPVVPCLLLVWFDVTKGAQCGVYCLAALVAMWAVMRRRRDDYAMTG